MDTWVAPAACGARFPESADALAEPTPSFEESFVRLFRAHHARLYRYLQRLSGEPELAADLVQDAFVRLYRRGSLPDAPEAWLISVASRISSATRARPEVGARGKLTAGPGGGGPFQSPAPAGRVRYGGRRATPGPVRPGAPARARAAHAAPPD